MGHIINRLLYSFYYMNVSSNKFLDKVLARFDDFLYHFMYISDINGEIKRKGLSEQQYKRFKKKVVNTVQNDLNFGFCMRSAKVSTAALFIPYICLLAASLRWLNIIYIEDSNFKVLVIVAGLLSYAVVYAISLRNDKYKSDFKKFKAQNHNVMWCLMTILFSACSIAIALLSIVLWQM